MAVDLWRIGEIWVIVLLPAEAWHALRMRSSHTVHLGRALSFVRAFSWPEFIHLPLASEMVTCPSDRSDDDLPTTELVCTVL